ncbi:MAG TPA: NADH-quinone oxidoreductase subunit J [Polyangiaceae bacterium]|jgi:NADH-quinone oxidoreductase subunit J|nr:MAG: NADH-quinone oxidoreductase subunit J [Deltaproteobacteria bacterium ADurb.Bin207]HNS98453.1 NADH-quinone oxidoreductase subunit J [Polyangiaceae bacterium]HNZ21518.1 NADH-quinone oxidoreductase subunit J [Polyangiaceae bacterium]HOD25542.1 NADH-quinone oxidoreductase subunit J [Polyangiaceae bacterium]HOE48184.1 NADH-quinone oxidoreductase subunit J [Polyangiaceae bacterium]
MINAIVEQGLFYVSALLAVAGALGTVASKSAIRSAMSLLATIVGIAGLYLTLSAQLLAAIQILVYAGAIVVLFVFVIMLLGGQVQPNQDKRTSSSRAIGAGLFALSAILAAVLVARAGLGGPHLFDPPRIEFGSVSELGRVMFTDGVIAFELIGVLLTTAIVGVMAVARTRHAKTNAKSKEVGP